PRLHAAWAEAEVRGIRHPGHDGPLLHDPPDRQAAAGVAGVDPGGASPWLHEPADALGAAGGGHPHHRGAVDGLRLAVAAGVLWLGGVPDTSGRSRSRPALQFSRRTTRQPTLRSRVPGANT